MAQPSVASREAVLSACAEMARLGEKITLANVRTRLGGGSLASIQPLVKEWRECQKKAVATPGIGDVSAEAVPVVPTRVGQALDAGRHALDAVAVAVADAITVAVAEERHRGRLELDSEREEWGRRLAEAQAAIHAAEEETAQLAEEARRIEAERGDLALKLANTTDAFAKLTEEHNSAREVLATERAAGEASRRELLARVDCLETVLRTALATAPREPG